MHKLQFATKVSLSLTLAYMIPMALGWEQPSTAAMVVMLIASTGGVSDSLTKGMLRVLGTVVGAFLGIGLIALFPQERMFYLMGMSLLISLITYLYYAYQGDSTALMLMAVMIMMIYINGPEEAFMYGVDRTYATLFGILVYTVIGLFLWPTKEKKGEINDAPKGRMFIWLDPENMKATLQLFVIFWVSVAFWIYFNPPAGFAVVMLATLLGMITTFSPIKPSILVILFSLSFMFATAMYILVLPNLVYGFELALFIFLYTFIAFYFIPEKLNIFFLLGLFMFNISNEMNYNFAVFLTTLLTFYMFLVILMLFYNFPFSTRPEHLFPLMKERFFIHSESIESLLLKKELSWLQKYRVAYHQEHLKISVSKMQLWSAKIDVKYFGIDPLKIEAFVKSTQEYLAGEIKLQKCYREMEAIAWNNLKMNRF